MVRLGHAVPARLLRTTLHVTSISPSLGETIELRVAPDGVESVAPADVVVCSNSRTLPSTAT
jgi:hypothetical protein